MATDVTSLAFFPGSRYIRKIVVQFFQYVFKTYDLFKDFKYVDDDTTKIHITSEFPDIVQKHPQIVVESSGYSYSPVGFGEHIGLDASGSEVYEYGGRYRIDGVIVKVRSYTQDMTEYIMDLCLLCFGHKKLKDKFSEMTGIYPNIGAGINVTDIVERPISSSNKKEWTAIMRIPGYIEFHAVVPLSDVDIIASERIDSDVE